MEEKTEQKLGRGFESKSLCFLGDPYILAGEESLE